MIDFGFIEYLSYLSWKFGWDEDETPESGDSDGDGPIILDGDDDNDSEPDD